MGNVLLDFNPEFVLNRFCSSDEEKNIIRKELFEGPEWLMGDKGDIKDADRFDLVKVRVPEKYHGALKNCANHWDICMIPLDGACRWIFSTACSSLPTISCSNPTCRSIRHFSPNTDFRQKNACSLMTGKRTCPEPGKQA